MKIEKIKNRSILFTRINPAEWNLNIQLIIGNKHNYIVDTGLGSLSIAPILEYIKYMNQDNKPIIAINTHYHWDHIWGNSSLQNSTILAHKLCRDMIDSNWDDMMFHNKHYIEGEAVKYLPNMIFEEEIYYPEDKIRIMYTPGHTIDSISVLDEEDKVLNAGDNIGDTPDEIIPQIDCEKYEYINTLLKYKEMEFDTCISGHNVVLDKQVIDNILKLIKNII
ncbi:glyoxylase-like metal-dependent hydrolase (beta-lactamase superfamily II) [Mobilisporobacter senegalensis]|uniref:Glyoxylase-like metal-dependent hydrolase (Beta-lactamase superfamily II) n=1 Tax=Mobilisporobacter senegalensis TaxID=1329262 RepID=A0A3N1X9K9_9FIRM|nr:MBL fold metallo-hydrolase [Mobilisporobacter senegalensis]ROR23460.1 glyoxylase-like metal-dependent hydrolase (beta-lactamase superfamily II) [Mobilisporobacter senegalensis]